MGISFPSATHQLPRGCLLLSALPVLSQLLNDVGVAVKLLLLASRPVRTQGHSVQYRVSVVQPHASGQNVSHHWTNLAEASILIEL